MARCPAGRRSGIDPPAEVNGVLRMDYDPKDFTFGTSRTRTVELRSPQLAAPVTITFSVTRIRSALWIPIIRLVGLMLGLLVRQVFAWLMRRGELARRRKELS